MSKEALRVAKIFTDYEKIIASIEKTHPLPAYYIKLHSVMRAMKEWGDKKTADFKEIRKTAEKKIIELEEMKKNLKNLSEEDKKDMFEQFVISQFTKVDKEERTWEKVMLLHALAFKQCAFMIECLEEIKKYTEGWQQKKKYWLFKAGDIMKCIKQGIEPKRGNPNNPDEQNEFDMDEGNEDKPQVRPSKGGASGYPSLGPRPDLGLPEGSDEESKSEKSDDDDDDNDDDESDEEPEEKPKPKPKAPAKPAPKHSTKSKESTVKRDKNFYKGIEQAKKHCKNCISNLGYSKVEPSIEELEKALEILRDLS